MYYMLYKYIKYDRLIYNISVYKDKSNLASVLSSDLITVSSVIVTKACLML